MDSMQLFGERSLDLTADGHIDLKILSSFDSDIASSGVVTMNMTVGGTLGYPLPQGHFQVSNGSISYAGLPSGLSELNGSLLFTRDRVHIETLSARTGGGTIDLKGDATNFNQQLNFNLTATGKGVRLALSAGRQLDGRCGVALDRQPFCFHSVGRHQRQQDGGYAWF